MKTIWKYTFEITDLFSLDLPRHASILHVDMQLGRACMWVLVDTSEQKIVRRNFLVAGTGHRLPDDVAWQWVATFQNPPHVWHLFELA